MNVSLDRKRNPIEILRPGDVIRFGGDWLTIDRIRSSEIVPNGYRVDFTDGTHTHLTATTVTSELHGSAEWAQLQASR